MRLVVRRRRKLVRARERPLVHVLQVLAGLRDQRRHAVRARVAAPRHDVRVVDEAVRSSRSDGAAADQILMGGETAAALRLEHVIGQDPLLCDVPIRLDLRLLRRTGRRPSLRVFRWPHEPFADEIEAVHLAAVVVREERRVAVLDIEAALPAYAPASSSICRRTCRLARPSSYRASRRPRRESARRNCRSSGSPGRSRSTCLIGELPEGAWGCSGTLPGSDDEAPPHALNIKPAASRQSTSTARDCAWRSPFYSVSGGRPEGF